MYIQIIRSQLKYVSEEEPVVLCNDLASTSIDVRGLVSQVGPANLTPTDCPVMEAPTGVARGLVCSDRDRPPLTYRRRDIFQQGGAR